MYVLVINRMRPAVSRDAALPAIAAHKTWIARGLATGTVVEAGRWGAIGGMVVLRVRDEAEARQIAATDPLSLQGVVDVELAQFWPDAAPARAGAA